MKEKILVCLLPGLVCFSFLSAQIGPRNTITPLLTKIEWMEPVDLDGDGDNDVVVAAGEYHQIGWYENADGEGTFNEFQPLTNEAAGVRFFKITDLDGDGDQDILAIIAEGSELVWFENLDGASTFGSPVLITDALQSGSLVLAADLNQDGDPDLVVADEGDGRVVLLKNLGQANFAPPLTLVANLPGKITLEIADMDNDQDLDIVYGSDASTNVKYLKNNQGQAIFDSEQSILSANNGVHSFAVVDMDGDSFPDVLYAPVGENKVFWKKNFGPGFFIQVFLVLHVEPGYEIQEVKALDVNGDGAPDVVICRKQVSSEDITVSWYKHLDGLGQSFGPSRSMGGLSNQASRALFHLTNLNANDRLDILLREHTFSSLIWNERPEISDNFFHVATLGGQRAGRVMLVDLDGDGDKDLLSYNFWIENKGYDPIFSKAHSVHPNYSSSSDSNFFVDFGAGDLDGDGDIDIVATSIYQDKVSWFQNDGFGNFTEYVISVGEIPQPGFVLVEDFDGDGDLDIVVGSDFGTSSAERGIFLFRNEDGAGSFSSPEVIFSPVSSSGLIAGDIDNDGDVDIVVPGWAGPGSDYIVTTWVENDGTGNFSTNFNGGGIWSYLGDDVCLGDINNDGYLDLIYTQGISDYIRWRKYVPDSKSFTQTKIIASVPFWPFSSIDIGDIDLDGDLDIIYTIYQQGKIAYAENVDGQGLVWKEHVIDDNFPSAALVFLRDIDGDGDLDIITGAGQSSNDILVFYKNFFSSPRLAGFVFWAENENGIFDTGELPLFQQNVSLEPDGLNTWNNSMGQYYFAVDTGQYILSCQPASGWQLSTDSLVNVTVNSTATLHHNFGLVAVGEVAEIALDVSSAPTRCGFTVPFWINCENRGNQRVDGLVGFTPDALSSLVSASPAPDSTDGNTFFWFFEEIPPSYATQIEVLLLMPGPDLIGTSLSFNASAALANNLAEANAQYVSVLNCAYDPNDKLATPSYPGYEEYALFGDEFVYTVRFQNTGTDTAFNVKIVDQLDPNLDWSSLQVISTSHPCKTTLNEYGKLLFQFDNILLPDSSVNELASQGFVKFSIQHLPNLSENTEIKNQAAILFDFNPPIVTNTISKWLVSELPLNLEIQRPCAGEENGSITLLAYGPDWNLEWSDGQLGFQALGLGADTITLIVTGPEGELYADTTIILIATDPVSGSFSTTPATNSNADGSATVQVAGGTPPYTYMWSTEPVQTDSMAIDLPSGNYIVTVTDAQGCIWTDTVTVEQILINSSKDWKGVSNYWIAPNPSTGDLRVEVGTAITEWSVRIFNSLGQATTVYSTVKGPSLLIEGLLPGIYLIHLETPEGVLGQEWVVVRY
jgi:uncharacterized repeat protein (TIGR01451 family)